jgi:nucleotide-binding universal stress UspA family protein
VRSILVQIAPDAGQDSRLSAAIALAAAGRARLTCLHTIPNPNYMIADPTGIAATPALVEAIEKGAEEHRERIRARLAPLDLRLNWLESHGEAATDLARHARFADLIVLSLAPESGEPALFSTTSSVALHARTPTLAIPQDFRSFDPAGPALIAWNGSHEASNALRASVPLLAKASSVEIVEIGEQPPTFTAADAAHYLAAHEITAQVNRIEPQGRATGERIIDEAGRLGAAYIVLGAYGHSRIRELFVGGVTRWMLNHSHVPLLMAH